MPQTYEQVEEFPFPWERVFHAAQVAIPRLPRMVVRAADRTTGRVVASKGMSLVAWGETIIVDVGYRDLDRTAVRVWTETNSWWAPLAVLRSTVEGILRTMRSELGLPARPSGRR